MEFVCIHCNSKNKENCIYCDYCYNHSKKCELCNGIFCPCITSFRFLMKPWVNWVNARYNIQTKYCGSCIDNIINVCGTNIIQSREIGINKKREIKLSFNEKKLKNTFVYSQF